jgi:myosin-1
VCALIEDKRPAGIFATLNDATATAHADPSAADNSFIQRSSMLSSNPNFEPRGNKFLIRHYAGDVTYNVAGMTDKNKDALIKDILDLVDASKDQFLHTLFPDRPDPDSKKRPPTAGDKIKVSRTSRSSSGPRHQPVYTFPTLGIRKRSGGELDEGGAFLHPNYQAEPEPISQRVRR